ncbi:MAG: EamA family transporter [Deltaproteobacteria bacterium]|jgi:transporter family protein|nr:EamA family transporter [Deltaproteobacteria bacterium]
MFIIYAILSSIFAALTTILVKIGLYDINSHLATAIRTLVVLGLSWAMVLTVNAQSEIARLSRRNLVFLALSGLCTGLSWLFYHKALQLGPVGKVAPIDKLSLVLTIILAAVFLREPVTPKTVAGMALLTLGVVTLT